MRHLRRGVRPSELIALVSWTAVAGVAGTVGLGHGGAPFGSLEVLAVPLLSLGLLFPCFVLMRRLSDPPPSFVTALSGNERLRAIGPVLTLGSVLALVWLLYGRLLGAQWSVIDDHEIMWFLGPGGRLSLNEIPAKIALTEVGHYGSYLRFRPAYYFLRLLETVAWGPNPALWYGARVAMLAVSMALLWFLVLPILGDVGGALLCAYVLSYPFWADIFGRLGPSESYAVLGLAVYLVGYVWCLRQVHKDLGSQLPSAVCIIMGTLLCVGSKENMLVLALPTAHLGYWAFVRRRSAVLAAVATSLLFSVFVG